MKSLALVFCALLFYSFGVIINFCHIRSDSATKLDEPETLQRWKGTDLPLKCLQTGRGGSQDIGEDPVFMVQRPGEPPTNITENSMKYSVASSQIDFTTSIPTRRYFLIIFNISGEENGTKFICLPKENSLNKAAIDEAFEHFSTTLKVKPIPESVEGKLIWSAVDIYWKLFIIFIIKYKTWYMIDVFSIMLKFRFQSYENAIPEHDCNAYSIPCEPLKLVSQPCMHCSMVKQAIYNVTPPPMLPLLFLRTLKNPRKRILKIFCCAKWTAWQINLDYLALLKFHTEKTTAEEETSSTTSPGQGPLSTRDVTTSKKVVLTPGMRSFWFMN